MAAQPSLVSIKKHFRRLRHARVQGRSKHLLIDLLVMTLCGIIAHCDDWPDIALFAQQRESWFRRFLALEIKGVRTLFPGPFWVCHEAGVCSPSPNAPPSA
jgi:hypothetical protein